MAASNNLKATGLRSLIEKRQWLSSMDIDEAVRICQSKKIPLGTHLKSLGLLDANQLKMLFYVQSMQQVCALFQVKEAQYQFKSDNNLPLLEMTGLSSPMTEVTLAGLRILKDWSALEEKIPDDTSGLIKVVTGEPNLTLNAIEKEVWSYTNGDLSLQEIADKVSLSLSEVKRIAFRLILVSLAEEVPLVHLGKNLNQSLTEDEENFDNITTKTSGLSGAFLQNLSNFLKSKAAA